LSHESRTSSDSAGCLSPSAAQRILNDRTARSTPRQIFSDSTDSDSNEESEDDESESDDDDVDEDEDEDGEDAGSEENDEDEDDDNGEEAETPAAGVAGGGAMGARAVSRIGRFTGGGAKANLGAKANPPTPLTTTTGSRLQPPRVIPTRRSTSPKNSRQASPKKKSPKKSPAAAAKNKKRINLADASNSSEVLQLVIASHSDRWARVTKRRDGCDLYWFATSGEEFRK